MHVSILRLIDTDAVFLHDDVFMKCPDTGKRFYNWRAGDHCRICGYVHYPDAVPSLLVFYGPDLQDTVEIAITDVSTELATADRRRPIALS